MSSTNNYSLNIPTGSDKVNILTQITPNFEEIDKIMKANEDAGIQVATELFSNKIHALTRTKGNAPAMRFTATSNYTAGDTFTVDGVQVTALAPNGSTLPDNAYVIGCEVFAILKNTSLTVWAGIRATDSDKFNGKPASFYATESEVDNAKSLAEGAVAIAQNATNVAQNSINKVNKLDIVSGFIANHENTRYKKMGKLVFVNGFIIVNGTNVTFTLPYAPVERVNFPVIGVSASLSPSNGYEGIGDCRKGSTSCNITLSGANTYAVVNFVYETT